MRMLIVASLPIDAGLECLKMFFCLVQAKLRFLKANCCLRVGLVLHGPNRIRGSMSPPFTCRMAKSCFLEASTRKLGKLCIVLLERHCSRRPAAQRILVGIELGRVCVRRRVTSLALSVARWGHDSAVATFSEAPL